MTQAVWIIGLLITMTGAPGKVLAQDDAAEVPPEHVPTAQAEQSEQAEEQKSEPFEDDWPYVDASHRAISSALELTVKKIDVFFADSKVYRDATNSYLQLTGDVIFREQREVDLDGRVRAKVSLPKTKERLKFLIETDPQERINIEGNAPSAPPPASPDNADETDYFASLEKVFPELKRWDIRPSVGIKFNSPVDPFVRLRLRRNTNFAKWAFRFEQNFFWFDSVGTVSNTLLEFNRELTKRMLFRSSSGATYRRETREFELSQTFTVFHTLSERRALAYETGVFGTDEPTVEASRYFVSVRYRQLIHKKWLFVELIPAVSFSKEDDWGPTNSLILRFDIVFGQQYI